METLQLNRLRTSAAGTFGILLRRGVQIAVTCELPWNNNVTGKSCVPSGTYLCTPHNGERFVNVWELNDVPERSAILMHNGNTIKDTDGCILVGGQFGDINGQPAVLSSLMTLNALRESLPSSFNLSIMDVPLS
jgi:Family of unknown function (DUF5675)